MKMTAEALTDRIKEVAGEVFAEQMKEGQRKGQEAAAAGPAQVVDLQAFVRALRDGAGRGAAVSAASRIAQPKAGDRFFHVMAALQAGNGDATKALAWARSDAAGVLRSSPFLEKDLSTVLESQGAILVREELSDDFIEFLRPAQVLAGLGARDVPMSLPTLVIPAHTIGSTGGWIGEGEPIPTTSPGFGTVEMRLHTYASVVPIPIDLLRYSFRDAEQFVGADMRLDISSAFDTAHLRGSGANGQPQGVRSRGRVTASLGTSLDNVVNDLVGCLERMGEASMPMQRLGWGISWKTWRRLFTLRGVNDHFLFKDELAAGTLLGAPFRRSGVIKNNYDPYASGTANKTELFCFDLDTVLLGRGDGVELYTSQDAAYETGGGVKSALSRRQVVVRATAKTDVQLRYRDGAQIVDGVAWQN